MLLRFVNSARTSGVTLALLTALIYAAWPAAARAVYDSGANASFLLLWAMLARAIPLCAISLYKRLALFPTREDTRQAFIGGALQALSTTLSFAAVVYIPGPLVIVILFSHTLMLLLYMAWRGEVILDRITLITTLTALIGLTFVLDLWHTHSAANFLGMGMAFLSALVIVSRMYVYGNQTKTRHPAAVGAENFITGNLFMPLILLFQHPHAPDITSGYGWLLMACVVLAIPTCLQFYAIAILGSFRFSLLLKIEPVFTTIFSALLVGEILRPSQYAGILLVTGSLALYQVIDHRRLKMAALTQIKTP
jgi:drug/metabolite transporter (DMT)-like permease